MNDTTNPQHYQHLPAETIEIILAAIAKAPSNEAAYLHGQTLKYLLRCWEKEGIEDLHKAKWYLDRLVGCDQLAEVAGAIPDLPVEPPKRHREPTQADLANGPIECEYRDDDDEPWRSGLLVYILEGEDPFLCVSKEGIANQWAQCRIEVAE